MKRSNIDALLVRNWVDTHELDLSDWQPVFCTCRHWLWPHFTGIQMISKSRVALVGCLMATCLTPAISAARTPKEISTELAHARQAVANWGQADRLMDPKYRKFFSEQVAPLIKNELQLQRELEAAQPSNKRENLFLESKEEALLAVLGDDASSKALDDAAHAKDPVTAQEAALGVALRDWWMDQTVESQQKILDNLKAQAKSRLTDDQLSMTLVEIADSRPASQELAEEARTLVEKEMKSAYAMRYRSTPNRLGRPLVITGTTVQGKSVSTLPWKGKVVMIDFWATWCPPCREELPKVIEMYKKYHDQGFEIMGVSNDSDRRALVQFLRDNPDMKWPQLYGPGSGADRWNVLSVRFGVKAIPTCYLIDRKGILRLMAIGSGRAEEMLPELLDEKAEPDAKAAGVSSAAGHE